MGLQVSRSEKRRSEPRRAPVYYVNLLLPFRIYHLLAFFSIRRNQNLQPLRPRWP